MSVLLSITSYLMIGIITTVSIGAIRDFVIELTKIRTHGTESRRYATVSTTTFITSWTVIVLTWVSLAILSGIVLQIPKTAITGIVTAIFAAVGLGSQKIIGDIMAGFTMLIERQARVGDTVTVSIDGKNETGTVDKVTLRTLSLITDVDGIVIIPNGKINYIINETITAGRFLITVPFSNLSKVEKIEEVVDSAIREARETEFIAEFLVDDGITSRRVSTLEKGVIEVSFVGSTLPGKQYDLKRRFNEILISKIESTDDVALAAIERGAL